MAIKCANGHDNPQGSLNCIEPGCIAEVGTLIQPVQPDPSVLPDPQNLLPTPPILKSPVKAALEVIRGDCKGQKFQIDLTNGALEVSIGRFDAAVGSLPDFDLAPLDPDRNVHRKHAVIRWKSDDASYEIQHLGGENGTYVGESADSLERVPPGQNRTLKNGMFVVVGPVVMRFSLN